MMSELSLAELMDPKRVELQTHYENYRIAVDKSYTIATKMPGCDKVAELVNTARALRPFIVEDLDAGIAILNTHDDKAKSS